MKKLLLALVAVSGLAYAESSLTNPFSVGLQAGAANASSNPGSGTASTAGAARLDFTYSFNQYMALQAGLTGTSSFVGATTTDSNALALPAGSLTFYDVSFKGTLPLGDLFDLHAQLGAAYAVPSGVGSYVNAGTGTTVQNTGGSSTFKALAGVGVGFNITRTLGVQVNDYGYLGAGAGATSGAGGNTNVVMGGVTYKF